jgi:hypothetical protein
VGKLQEWLDEDWVRIDSSGNIAGECGTSKNKKNPDRCLPRAKAQSLSKNERASTARKKKRAGSQGQQVVANTRAATVKKAARGGEIKGGGTMGTCTKKMKYGGAVKKAPKKMKSGGAVKKSGCKVRGYK